MCKQQILKAMALVLVLLTAAVGIHHSVAVHAELRQRQRQQFTAAVERYQHELRHQCSLRTDVRVP